VQVLYFFIQNEPWYLSRASRFSPGGTTGKDPGADTPPAVRDLVAAGL
jgi:hypothetical protein